jgi:glyoxylase-like metal-dependent hydrolase (beta-lactamase superfamily II)
MSRERVSEDIYVFMSDVYAQVTSGLILTPEGAVVIDTLPYPFETQEIVEFVKTQSPIGVRFVINTHSHADHVFGNYLFPRADIVAHRLCRQSMIKHAEQGLREAQEQNPELADVVIRLPNLAFQGELTLRLGGKTIQLMHMPGHTADSIVALVKEDRVLFSGDAMMPVPYVVWGDVDEMIDSLRTIRKMNLENIVQGHGEVLLRGEINETIDSSIGYLREITRCVTRAVKDGTQLRELLSLDIERCGKSRIPLNGLVQQLHQGNLKRLYERLTTQVEKQEEA